MSNTLPHTIARLALVALALFPTASWARSDRPDVQTYTLAGSYLAGRIARSKNDNKSAVHFYRRALAHAPNSKVLLEQSFLSEATEGNWKRAIVLARQLIVKRPGHRLAHILLGVSAFKKQDYKKADRHFQAADSGPIGELTATIARGWLELGRGNSKKALQHVRQRSQAEWAQYYVRYHRALIADIAGRHSTASRDFENVFDKDSRTLRTALAYARHAANQREYDKARDIINKHTTDTQSETHPLATSFLKRLKKRGKIKLLVTTPVQGMTEVFYGLGESLTGEGGVNIGIVYLQMALFLQPNHPFALAALANAYETIKRYDQAIAAYDKIAPGSPLQSAIAIRKAFNLNSLDRVDEAKKQLDALAKRRPNDIKPLDALGNIMRAHKRYPEAVEYYTRAIALLKKPTKQHWSYFYARGTCYERLKQWPLAEKDLQRALELYPNQPLALNYLGYSWIDQNYHLREGMSLIEKAVALKPDDGYIVDSLGWAHFKLGNFAKAATHLERAVELRPEDPVLNDHLGDALWRVGREREARFQWDQALTLAPEPENLRKIKEKLANGLPVKLQASAEQNTVTRASPTTKPHATSAKSDGRGSVPPPSRAKPN